TTITLTGGQLELTDTNGTTSITGAGSGVVAISGNGASRVLRVDAHVTAAVNGVTIKNGLQQVGAPSNAAGGGVFNAGTLALTNCLISGNVARKNDSGPYVTAVEVAEGGGIYNSGILTITGSTVYSNEALGVGQDVINNQSNG